MARELVDGVVVAIDDDRQAGDGAPALVWGHGLTSSRAHEDEASLFALGPALRSAGVRLVRYDAPGHGRSGGQRRDDAYRWDRLAATMLGVAAAAGLDRCILGGASMGCATALFAALADPRRVGGLVLAVPPTAWTSRPEQAELYRAAAALVDAEGPAGLARAVLASPPGDGYGERGGELLGISARHVAAMDGELLAHVLRGAAASDLPPLDDLTAIGVPALVLALRDDPTHPLATAEALVAALPDARLHVADDLDAVAAWSELVARFVVDVAR